ncbi:MAG: hypothetical protein A2374_01820 [Candidatus Moranbacteria bacterium RIFOXYB1_FULL_44_23]|nr:MAG: hypothetical protein A2374_01820 [Candidatus Moranbacteria bacterium RIFOXYB1_FULL_44_23]HBB36473.1 hypothetical protein [Candidatus Moranbacteria bacterium]HBU25254.1 hypothetical protein [Candidatus Moranbacteria bacterium]
MGILEISGVWGLGNLVFEKIMKDQYQQLNQDQPSRPGYEYLIVFMLGKIIQDLTVQFCNRWIEKRSRTHDQMVQAARSNSQNIAEGSTGESLKSYIKLVGVAHGSNEELAKDFQDFLRQRNLPIWPKDHPKVAEFRKFRAFWVGPTSLNTPNLPNDPTEAANFLLTLCSLESFLLSRHVASLKKKHEEEGGFTENLYRKRVAFRKKIGGWGNSGGWGVWGIVFLGFLGIIFGAFPVRGTNQSIFTVSVWVKPSGSAVSKAILGKAEELRVATNASSQPVCQIKSGAAWQTAATSSVAISVDSWSHVSCTYDLAYVRIYVNGVEKGSQALAVAADDTAAVWKIGRDDSASTPYGYFAGQIDEYKFYNSALTADQIALDMNQGKEMQLGGQISATGATGQAAEYCVPGDTTSCAGPVMDWSLDEKTGQYAYDRNGGNNNVTLGSGSGADDYDPVWQGSSQCKTGSCLRFDGSNDYSSFSTTGMSVSAGTVSLWVNYSRESGWQQFFCHRYSESRIYVGVRGTTNLLWTRLGTSADEFSVELTENVWHQVFLTWNGGSFATYLDGTQVDSGSYSGLAFLGSCAGLGDYNIDCASFNTLDQNLNGNLDNVKVYNYARTPAQIAWDYNRGKPVGHWKLDEGEGDKAYDSSGNGNIGTLTTMDPPNDWVDGKFGKALDFDGESDYVILSDPTGLTDKVTVSAWIKMGVADPGASHAVSYHPGFYISGNDTTDNMRFCINQTNCANFDSFSSLGTGSWHHYVGVYDGSQVRTYLDGQYKNFVNTSGNIDTTGDFRFGKYWNGSYYWTGQIDDVRVYNYALTAEQIKQVMNEGSAIRFGD